MQRFYVNFSLLPDIEVTDWDIHHQLTRVLRMQVGESVILFSGDGSESEYEIRGITKKSITLCLKKKNTPQTEPTKQISLYQALPNKIEKLEYIIQKGVEVGISRFIFFRSDFSQKLILSDSKKQRFHIIAREALEQCWGLRMPEIIFEDSISYNQYPSNILNTVLDTTGISKKLTEMPQNQEISLWVGPEGGWSENERNKMKENGFIFVRFWERIMRTETAGVVTAFSLIYQ